MAASGQQYNDTGGLRDLSRKASEIRPVADILKSLYEDAQAILKKAGYDDASVYEHGSMRRVVYGAYKTEKEAAVQLHELRKKDHRFDSTWVQKLK